MKNCGLLTQSKVVMFGLPGLRFFVDRLIRLLLLEILG